MELSQYPTSKIESSSNIQPKRNIIKLLTLIIPIIVISIVTGIVGYKIGSNNIKVIVRKIVIPNTISTITPTLSPSRTNIVSIKEREQYKLITINRDPNPSCIYELHLVETNTIYNDPNDRVLGHPFCNGIKNNFSFSPNGSTVAFVNYDNNTSTIENGSISVYSIPEIK